MQAPQNLDPVVVARIALLILFIGTSVLAAWCWAIVRLALGDPLMPRVPRRIVPWGAMSVVASVFLYLGLQIVVVTGYFVARRFGGGAVPKVIPPGDQLLVGAIFGLATVQFLPLFLWATSGATLADLGLTGRDLFKNIGRGLIALALVLPIVYVVLVLSLYISKPAQHPVELSIRDAHDPWTIVVAVFTAVIAAPLSEELVFRGVLLASFWKVGARRPQPVIFTPEIPDHEIVFLDESMHAPSLDDEAAPPAGKVADSAGWLGNILVSLIFAGMHYAQWPAPVPLFFLSLALGEIYRRTGSLAAPIALHAGFNGLSTAMMLMTAK